ncbi:AraC family transcriptional regulator [Rhizobium sp. P44RR-XXIV]|uniref:AraC family transcriptional regulator n=1 Tax=Rhizobium sp. P44RR-XXIV TaxID=1921145 RepID=UPI000985E8A2|nr:AraC family transcriptional regulator [Rhizobium sp. P44RR-XXIV]TIX87118.1 AraC family transcriptional regulator [Rhizobium sp. P44RR-XXIV]
MRYVTQSVFEIEGAEAEEMTAHYERTLFPAVVEPLHPGALVSVEDRHYTLGDFSVWNGKCRSGMRVTLSGGPDAYVLYLPSSGKMAVDIGGKRLESEPGRGLMGNMSSFERLILHEQRSHIGIAFEKSMVTRQLSELLDAPVVDGLEFTGTIDLSVAEGLQIASLGRLIWESLTADDAERSSSLFSERLLQAMMIALLEVVPNNYSMRLLRPASPAVPKTLKRAVDYMHANPGSNIGIADIAREAGVSVRTLQAVFQQFKETTPLNYLRTIRLKGVRNSLTDPGCSRSVAEVARDWGFSHMGRFAALYHLSFGEMPSDTVRLRRGQR